jgi:hypothetical protein
MAIDAMPPKDVRPDWTLPDVLNISIRRVDFTPRQYKYFRSSLAEFKEAVEFMVRLSGSVPVRALGPALFVGDVPVTEAEAEKDDLYRFLAFNLKQFKAGAPIAWGWIDTPKAARKITRFRFVLRDR